MYLSHPAYSPLSFHISLLMLSCDTYLKPGLSSPAHLLLCTLDPLPAAIWGTDYNFFFKMALISWEPASVQLSPWRQYTWARLERYLQNGAIIRIPRFTHRPPV